MSDQPDNLVLAMLRRMDAKMDRMADDIREIKQRLSSLEGIVAILHGDIAGQSGRIDRIELRLERIEQRLDLVDAP